MKLLVSDFDDTFYTDDINVLKNITGENNNGTPKRILHVIFSNNATQYNSNCKYSNIFHDICNNRAPLWSVMVII